MVRKLSYLRFIPPSLISIYICGINNMAKQAPPKKKDSKEDSATLAVIRQQFTRIQIISAVVWIIVLVLNGGAHYFLGPSLGLTTNQWIVPLGVSSALLVLMGLVVIGAITSGSGNTQDLTDKALEKEIGHLRAATKRAETLQDMASIMRSTLNFNKVVDSALESCGVVLEEMGIPAKTLVGAVLTFDGRKLTVAANRRLGETKGQSAAGEAGALKEALETAEPVIVPDPKNDPEIKEFVGLRRCKAAVVLPLRVGYELFGVMVVGSEMAVNFDEEHLKTFTAIADQAVIALNNAKLYQGLEREKQRLIAAEAEARKQLSRDLHDGPTQSVAAIAMRINFIRSMMKHETQEFIDDELSKVEQLAKDTGRVIRGMLFTLRPLVLDEKGLGPAVESVMERIRETDGLNMRLVGSENGDLLSPRAQSMIFYIVEEALGNARKYSKANLIEVRFWREADLFVARIQDDGVGFNVEEVTEDYSSRGSLGMINMQERAETIGASVKVESQPGKGTAITIVVPLASQGQSSRK